MDRGCLRASWKWGVAWMREHHQSLGLLVLVPGPKVQGCVKWFQKARKASIAMGRCASPTGSLQLLQLLQAIAGYCRLLQSR